MILSDMTWPDCQPHDHWCYLGSSGCSFLCCSESWTSPSSNNIGRDILLDVVSDVDDVVDGKECSLASVGEASSSIGLDIQSRLRLFRRPGPDEGEGTLSISSILFGLKPADKSFEKPSSVTGSSMLTSDSDRTGVGIISTRVSGNETRFAGWNMRFAGRFDKCVVCLLGSGLLRRMLRAPRATMYGAALAKGEFEPEDTVEIDEVEREVCGEGLCTGRIWVKASSGRGFEETGVDGSGSKAFS